MFAPIWNAVTARPILPRPARLAGYRRHSVVGETYPALVANANANVDGALYEDVDQATLALLDQFEGIEYQRILVLVTLSSAALAEPVVFKQPHWPVPNGVQPAYVYLFVASSLLLDQSWSPGEFAEHGMAPFMATHIKS